MRTPTNAGTKRFVSTSYHRGQFGGMLCRNATYASALGNAVVRRPSCRRTANMIARMRARTEDDVTVAVGDAENNIRTLFSGMPGLALQS